MMRRFCLDNREECTVFDVFIPELSDIVDPDFTNGWLCFECDDQRRRLAPIPDNWERLADRQLSLLWARARREPNTLLGFTP